MRAAAKVLVMLVGAAAMAACAGPGNSQPTPTPAPPTSSEATPAPTGEREAVSAYRGMWDAFSSAARSSDWQSTELARYASGYALDQIVQGLQTDSALGVVTEGSFTINPAVVSSEPKDVPTVVLLLDCFDDSHTTRLRASDKTELPGGTRGRHKVDAKVERNDKSVWTVVDFRLRAAGTC